MGLASEFKEFAMKGNVVDMAVGVIVGAAFGKIVSSLVGDVIMPALGKLIGGINFSDLAVSLGTDPNGKEVLVKYGAFLQTIFDFMIIALVLFIALTGDQSAEEAAGAGRCRAGGTAGRGQAADRDPRPARASLGAAVRPSLRSGRVRGQAEWQLKAACMCVVGALARAPPCCCRPLFHMSRAFYRIPSRDP